MGIGNDVGQPLLLLLLCADDEGARQPLRMPWHASLNSNAGKLRRGTGAVKRWLMYVVPTGVSLRGIAMVSTPANSGTVSRWTRSAARLAKGSDASQYGSARAVALLQHRGGGGGVAGASAPSRHCTLLLLLLLLLLSPLLPAVLPAVLSVPPDVV
jgi:hypothetical protein